mmetsp:Transcript_52361/g.135128  ORF Transcript_52361/g.135128 Transcript_52361/m.135128 type:complete len:734 (-) Transcript_52361:424-2625(-)
MHRLDAAAAHVHPCVVGALGAAPRAMEHAARVVHRARAHIRHDDGARELHGALLLLADLGQEFVADHHVVDEAGVLVREEVAVENEFALEDNGLSAFRLGRARDEALLKPQAAAGRHEGSVTPLTVLEAEEWLAHTALQDLLHSRDARDHSWEVSLVDVKDLEGVHVDVVRVVDGVAAADVPLRALSAVEEHVHAVHVEHLEGVLVLLPVGDAPLDVRQHLAVKLLREGHVLVEIGLQVQLGLAGALQLEVAEILLRARVVDILAALEEPVLLDIEVSQQLRVLASEGGLERDDLACVRELDEEIFTVTTAHKKVRIRHLEETHLVHHGRKALVRRIIRRLLPGYAIAGNKVERHNHLGLLIVELDAAHPLSADADGLQPGQVASLGLERGPELVVDQVRIHGGRGHRVRQVVVQLDTAHVDKGRLLLLLQVGVGRHELVVGEQALEAPLGVPDHERVHVRVLELEPLLLRQIVHVLHERPRAQLRRQLPGVLDVPDLVNVREEDAEHAAPRGHGRGAMAVRVVDVGAHAVVLVQVELVAVALLAVLPVRLDGDPVRLGFGRAHGVEDMGRNLHTMKVEVEDIPGLVGAPSRHVLRVPHCQLAGKESRLRHGGRAHAHDVPDEDVVLAQVQVLHLHPVPRLGGYHVLDVERALMEGVLHQNVELLTRHCVQARAKHASAAVAPELAEPLVEAQRRLALHRLEGAGDELDVMLGDRERLPALVQPRQNLQDRQR